MLLLDGKVTLFIFFVYIYAFVFVSLNECFTSSLFLFYKLSRKYVIQTKEHVKQKQKIPILSVNVWLWLLSWKYKLKTCGKMYFKKLVRLQIFYIHKFLFYVILCHRVHIWWPSILFQSCHGKRSGYMHASHTTLFEISSHDSWFWRGLNDQYV